MISDNAHPLPAHWPRIIGLDFGYDHPAAAVWLAWDRDSDTVYVTDEFGIRGIQPGDAGALLMGKERVDTDCPAARRPAA